MTTQQPPPRGTRASDADRQKVIDALSDAQTKGEITFGEFEERSRAASAAITLQQLVPLTVDLQGAAPITPPPDDDRANDAAAASVKAFAVRPSAKPARSPLRQFVSFLIGLTIMTGVVLGIIASVAAAMGGGPSILGKHTVHLHTADGYREFVADVKAKFGTTTVDSAVVYPTYAVLSVPVDGHATHLESYYYDGDFNPPNTNGNREKDDATVDLAAIDPKALATLMIQAPQALNLPEPTSRWATIESWGDPAQPAFYVYVSDSYDSGYLVASATGRLLDAYPVEAG